MEKSIGFESLVVWQRAHEFVLATYKVTASFPKHEMYGLISQFRRAAVSIAANIAESFRKRSAADKARFMEIAECSLEECRYYLILSRDLGYTTDPRQLQMLDEVSKMLRSYVYKLRHPDA